MPIIVLDRVMRKVYSTTSLYNQTEITDFTDMRFKDCNTTNVTHIKGNKNYFMESVVNDRVLPFPLQGTFIAKN